MSKSVPRERTVQKTRPKVRKPKSPAREDQDQVRAAATRATIRVLIRTRVGLQERTRIADIDRARLEAEFAEDALHPERAEVAVGTLAKLDPAMALQVRAVVEAFMAHRRMRSQGAKGGKADKKRPELLFLLRYVRDKIAIERPREKFTPRRFFDWMATQGHVNNENALKGDHGWRFWVHGEPDDAGNILVGAVQVFFVDAAGRSRDVALDGLDRYFRLMRDEA